MIGVDAPAEQLQAVHEFFELFKTHWEPAVSGRKYDAVLSTDGRDGTFNTDVHLVYGSMEQTSDREAGVVLNPHDGPTHVLWRGTPLPIYTRVTTLGEAPEDDAPVSYTHLTLPT